MAWMKEVALTIEFAGAHGVNLEVSDFRRDENGLTIDGMPADDWMTAKIEDCDYAGKDGE